MANIRDLKKDINYVLGDIIEAVYIVEQTQDKEGSKEGTEIIDKAIDAFDELIAKVNQKDVEDVKSHMKGIRKELEDRGRELIDRINKMA